VIDIRLRIYTCSPAQILVDFFGLAGNIAGICANSIDTCLIAGALGIAVPAVFRRGIEIGAFTAAYLEIIFAYYLAFAFDALYAFVTGIIAAAAIIGVAHNVDTCSPTCDLAFCFAGYIVFDTFSCFAFFPGTAFFFAAAAVMRI
jgi:hypothetical protein